MVALHSQEIKSKNIFFALSLIDINIRKPILFISLQMRLGFCTRFVQFVFETTSHLLYR